MPGPRKLAREERLALSKDALKMNGMPSAPVISFKRPATSSTSAFAFDDAGTGDQEERPIGPDLEGSQFHAVARPGCRAARYSRAARTNPVNSGCPSRGRRGELRVELAGDEPRMRAQLDEFHQAVRRESGEAQAGRGQLLEIVIVEFIAVAMALENRFLAVDGVRQRAGHQAAPPARRGACCRPGRISRRAPAGRAPGPAIR